MKKILTLLSISALVLIVLFAGSIYLSGTKSGAKEGAVTKEEAVQEKITPQENEEYDLEVIPEGKEGESAQGEELSQKREHNPKNLQNTVEESEQEEYELPEEEEEVFGPE
ncbi:MAG: hypothetical protein HY999_02575 [Nitrospinae bacterium]|nr:hypothetical protein [Nitrospinota bacterium]